MNTLTIHPRSHITGLSLLRAIPFFALVIGSIFLGILPAAQAVLPPPAPDGNYPGDNTAEGDFALQDLTTGVFNVAIGFNALTSNTSGGENTACGAGALNNNTSGNNNAAMGGFALAGNTTGDNNTASGVHALYYNSTGYSNTATGAYSLQGNQTGYSNTTTGAHSLQANKGGWYNTANGDSALYSNQAGNWNTAMGALALYSNTGSSNTACGAETLQNNTSGTNNLALGALALFTNSTGYFNSANGAFALYNNTTGHDNSAVGIQALANNKTGSFNVAFGSNAGANLTTGSNNIDIGNKGLAGDARKIRIGTAGTHNGTFIAGIRGTTTANSNAVPVVIDSAGQLGTVSSSAHFKTDIKPMAKSSESVFDLKPVTFHYKSDGDSTAQFGLIAEEVAKVDPNLVVRDENGEIYTVRYDAVNAMLLNEFLKEHRKAQEQQATIAELKSAIAEQKAANACQEKRINALSAGLQKVSESLKSNTRVSQVASTVD